jgi:hypothetical protein
MLLDIILKNKRLKGSAISLVALVLGFLGVDADASNILFAGGALYQVLGWLHAIVRQIKTQGKAVV